jgi:hypothetical protein
MANNNNLRLSGEYRSAHLEMEKRLRACGGPVMESAIIQAVADRAPQFRNENGELKNILTGETLEEFCALTNLRKKFGHWFADYAPPSSEQALADRIEDVMLSPNLTKLGALYKEVGAARYETLCAEWGCDPVRLKPGVRPEYVNKPEVKKATNRAANPWSKEGWNITRQGGIVTSLGMERAASMARAVGCVIGSTKPNLDPRYN